ncbi:MAG TPA: tetratricopeptide repeat protein [Chthoniobacterales bacterium]|jgi:TolB-like protein/Flp pilus assembly protein TadD
MSEGNFFSELKRRNVYKVAITYAVVAWLLIQAASILLPTFEAPAWVMKALVVFLALGFVISVMVSWAFEATPEGLKRTEDVPPEVAAKLPTWSRRKFAAFIVMVALVAAALLGYQLSLNRNMAAPRDTPSAAPGSSIPQKSIAVLPFENLSDDKGAAYFADGIQDEILTKLASIADLKVISRTSTAKYKSKPEDLKTVSQQLGVATVLEGSVQKAADKVRVNVQLIDARADSHLWAKTYDRDIKDVFAVESEVAQEIADSLKAKLSPAEANTMASAPTNDMLAYDLFLKGEYEHRAGLSAIRAERFDQAAAWYNEAIARDPGFALAMAELVVCRMRRHWLVESLTESELTEVGTIAKKALSLAPDLAQAHVALGVFHYYGFRQYDLALAEFQRAIELQPNNSEALQFVAYVHRRQGNWDRALDELQKTLKLDPRNASIEGNIAQTYCFLRRWKDAEATARHTLTIDPHEATSMGILLLSYLNRDGNTREALRALASYPSEDLLVPNGGTYVMVIGRRAETHVLNRDYTAALKEWEKNTSAASNEGQRLAARTTIRVFAGQLSSAQGEAEQARLLFETRLHEHPGEVRSMRVLSWIYLALGRKDDAIKISQQALELLPPEKDWGLGPANLTGLAEIQAQTGATSDAVNNLRRLLSLPAGEAVSIARLKLDPVWDPIRKNPGFQQLLAGSEHVGP